MTETLLLPFEFEFMQTALIISVMIAIPAAVLGHFYENRILKLMNEIEEMAFNLLPQFERYEGQVRFTQGAADAIDQQGKAPDEIAEDPIATSA